MRIDREGKINVCDAALHIWEEGIADAPNFSGYRNNTTDAGKFTRSELDKWLGIGVTEDSLNRVVPV